LFEVRLKFGLKSGIDRVCQAPLDKTKNSRGGVVLGNNQGDPSKQQLPSRTPKAFQRPYSILLEKIQIPPILKTPLLKKPPPQIFKKIRPT
jgi:hypothetical protein